jgi:Extracellular link domain
MNNSRNNFLGDGALGDAVNSAVNVLNNGKATTFTNAMNNVGKTATNVVNNLAAPTNSVGATFTNAVNAVGTTAANAVNSVGTTFTNAVNAVGTTAANAANSVGATFTNAVNTVGTNAANAVNAVGTNAANAMNTNTQKSNFLNVFKNSNLNNASPLSMMNYELLIPISIFVALVTAFGLLFYFFTTEIKTGYDNLSKTVQSLFSKSLGGPAPVPAPVLDNTPDHPLSETPIPQSQSILEKVLPLNKSPEVFNVNKNDFTYYDAEPLCKALGAELATYDQVKDAYGKGADWCNYGWVKGQVAIYPTQKATWDEIQKGDGSERDACGKPGVNGGYFDNPEMKFGVNCYGPKPSQSEHDEAQLMKQGRIPMTTSALKTEQKVKEFEAQANSLGIMPFNKNNWQAN